MATYAIQVIGMNVREPGASDVIFVRDNVSTGCSLNLLRSETFLVVVVTSQGHRWVMVFG